MIVEEQLKEWEALAKFKNNIMMDMNPTIILLLIQEVRELNNMVNYLSYLIGKTNCNHSFGDCNKDMVTDEEDCAKCWKNFVRREVTNANS